ncbi:hypothetical protein ACJX0J_028273 [Zea mays]
MQGRTRAGSKIPKFTPLCLRTNPRIERGFTLRILSTDMIMRLSNSWQNIVFFELQYRYPVTTTWASATVGNTPQRGLNKLAHMLREEEIKNFFKHNKAPGPDGFPAENIMEGVAYDNAGGSEEQDGLSILQYADDTLNNSDWKIWMEREAYLSYRGSRENRLLSLINEDGIGEYITCSVDLTNSGQFTVQSMYMSIINNGNVAVSVAFHLFIDCHVAHFITNVYLFAGLRCIDHFHFLSDLLG